MRTKDYLAYVVREIHTTIVATVDDDRLVVMFKSGNKMGVMA